MNTWKTIFYAIFILSTPNDCESLMSQVPIVLFLIEKYLVAQVFVHPYYKAHHFCNREQWMNKTKGEFNVNDNTAGTCMT